MARVLVVYHRAPRGQWRSTYNSHLYSFRRFSEHECYYLNTARTSVPKYLRELKPDVVIFHYTFLAVRQIPELFEQQVERIRFIADFDCPKSIIPHDEQAHSDLLCSLSEEFGVTHVFTPASPPEWPQIYDGLDFDKVKFVNVLTGYVDDETVRAVAKKAKRHHGRPIDIGYRSWDTYPFYGRHGLLKGEIGKAFKERAPEYRLVTDISSDYKDAFLGDSWFDFLLKCKYTIGVEGGSSVFDRDGSIAEKTRAYCTTHDKPSFEEVEAAVFPGMDGQFGYRLLGPRHLEAIMTRTCQVLIEGHYGGTMEPGEHYIELKRDFSNLEDVLALLKADTQRAEITERAYQDVIASKKWTYHSFADLVFSEMLASVDLDAAKEAPSSFVALWNRLDGDRLVLIYHDIGDRLWRFASALSPESLKRYAIDSIVLLFGEEQVWRFMVGMRNKLRKLQGKPPLGLTYVPTMYEAARRKRETERDATKSGKR